MHLERNFAFFTDRSIERCILMAVGRCRRCRHRDRVLVLGGVSFRGRKSETRQRQQPELRLWRLDSRATSQDLNNPTLRSYSSLANMECR